ncbi:type II 3-dehydroquinate dehydratase [Shinella zoogloeoides]|uniref:type II 3-dehydroquinate dehydratase n=1 Tax=Shinella zoogloeoides TaxID=352475 RepID=UPI00299E6F0A|nr:type II 3-dehydroquinate dehydratase [Shinella zoogloeoides]
MQQIGNLEDLLQGWAADLGIEVEHFRSNHEGKLLEFVHEARERADAFLVNPGGLVRVGESLRHTLKDSKKPCAEIHMDNAELNKKSIFSDSVLSIFSGFGPSTYLGALTALTLALDEPSFLHPQGDSPYNRAHGAPRSLYQ